MTTQYTAPSKASSSPLANLISETPSRAVYRGTSGQKITDTFTADPFLMKQLTTSANLLIGNNIRADLREPSYNELVAAVSAHLCPDETALRYALRARKAPLAAKNALGLMHVAGMIAPAIQTYADVLEAELKKAE